MDFTESTKIVYSRIQQVDPENVSKIIGYLLLHDHGERDMIRRAFSPDNLIHSLVLKVKTDLGLITNKQPVPLGPLSPTLLIQMPDVPLQYAPFSSPVSVHPVSPSLVHRPSAISYWDRQASGDQQHLQHNLDYVPQGYSETTSGEEFRLRSQMQYMTMDDRLEFVSSANQDFSGNFFYPESALGPRTSRRSPSLPELPAKICHYFSKGHCKHGSNCRFFHGHHHNADNFSQNSSDMSNEERAVSPGSLERLEMELTELLKSRRGMPVSIASLPMMYYEKYGRTLQAEGYLTESQRHGKAGYSLTKLLARLSNSIRLLDRPHGQHSVILAEDVSKYFEYGGERNDPGGIVAGSRQIYLTFPAESTFTELDVSNYFSKFGAVQDVRIPCQQKRMFGFVTFVFAETVRQILAKGNPHFVCGARVLVKPYREKSRLFDRKFSEKMHQAMYYNSHYIDGDSELHQSNSFQVPRVSDNSRLMRMQLLEEREQALELERRCQSEMQLAKKAPLNNHSYFGYSMNGLKLSEGTSEPADFPSAERLNYLLDVLSIGSTSEDKVGSTNANYNEQESQGINLPESPFAAPIGSSISTVM
ncbi:Zinc finger CCCH domain-containing protein 18 [Linum perenne]